MVFIFWPQRTRKKLIWPLWIYSFSSLWPKPLWPTLFGQNVPGQNGFGQNVRVPSLNTPSRKEYITSSCSLSNIGCSPSCHQKQSIQPIDELKQCHSQFPMILQCLHQLPQLRGWNQLKQFLRLSVTHTRFPQNILLAIDTKCVIILSHEKIT